MMKYGLVRCVFYTEADVLFLLWSAEFCNLPDNMVFDGWINELSCKYDKIYFGI